MYKTEGLVETQGSQEFLFSYSEEEKQNNKINKANAELVANFRYLVVPREILRLGLSGNDVLILSFVHSWLAEKDGRFYFSNQSLANIFNLSTVGVSNILTNLQKKGLLSLSYNRKADGGQIRFVNIPTYKNFKYQLKESLSSNLKKVYGSSNKISSNKISNSSLNKIEVGTRETGKEFMERKKKEMKLLKGL